MSHHEVRKHKAFAWSHESKRDKETENVQNIDYKIRQMGTNQKS